MNMLPVINKICPKCGSGNYMRSLEPVCKKDDKYRIKCINCLSYFTLDEIYGEPKTECCDNCKLKLKLKKADYSKGGCEDTYMDGYACMVFADEGVVTWMVGCDPNKERCECYQCIN